MIGREGGREEGREGTETAGRRVLASARVAGEEIGEITARE